MKSKTGSEESKNSAAVFSNSKKIYVSGELHSDIRVSFREITLAPTKSMNGHIEINEPVRVYDTSGPWGDPDFHGDVTQGLPPLRAKWIRERGDVEEIDGRKVQPIDDGFLSEKHARLGEATSPKALPNAFGERVSPLSRQRKPLRASAGCAVTQLAYARRGVITPEMEFIAIRENALGDQMGRRYSDGSQHWQKHSRHAGMDHSQQSSPHRHSADLSGARKSGRPGRGTELGNLSRHVNRTGRTRCGLFYCSCGRALTLHSFDG